MPPLRLSVSRRLAPFRRMAVSGIRDLSVPPSPIVSFPNSRAIRLQSEGSLIDFEASLAPPGVVEIPVADVGGRAISSFSLDLIGDDDPSQFLDALKPSEVVGRCLPQKAPRSVDPPTPLPRSYRLVWVEGSPTVEKAPDWLDLLRPILAPPVLTVDGPLSDQPYAVRPYQYDAIRALLAHDGLLLADDPGTAKAKTVCLAVLALLQVRQIHRALLVCPVGRLRRWAEQLMTWAPWVQTTVIQGSPAEREIDWHTPAHVTLSDYKTIVEDIEHGAVMPEGLHFDLAVLDAIQATRRKASRASEAIHNLFADRRWALAGGPPRDAEDWLTVFSFVAPDLLKGDSDVTLPDLKQRFRPRVFRRTKVDLADQLPVQTREKIWVKLDPDHERAYLAAEAEERERLSKLGGAITRTHISAAVDRLKKTSNFAPDSFDGSKVQALVDLVEEVVAAGSKVIVFSQYQQEGHDRLLPVLEAYGALRFKASSAEIERADLVSRFRNDPNLHVLLADLDARTDGEPLEEASYIVHFDHGWNPAVRRRAEGRIHPRLKPSVPITVYELWVTDTIDHRLHDALAKRGMSDHELGQDTRPADLEERMTIDDWLTEVFQVLRAERPASAAVRSTTDTGLLPVSGETEFTLPGLSPEDLMDSIAHLMRALGFPESNPIGEWLAEGGDLLAWRHGEGDVKRVLVRCVRIEQNVGVSEAKSLLKALDRRMDCIAAYLVATSDFTTGCKKHAKESDGRLALVSGSELTRHLQILGWPVTDRLPPQRNSAQP